MPCQPCVFVVEDDHEARASLHQLLAAEDMHVDSFSGARDFLESYDPDQPGCLLLDVRLPGMSGLELLDVLASRNISIPTVILTGYGEVPMAVRSMKTGTSDFIEKPYRADRLLASIRRALAQDAEARRLRSNRMGAWARIGLLTPREREVMAQFAEGKGTKEIAARFSISPKTVQVHRAHILKKTHANSIVELTHVFLLANGQLTWRRTEPEAPSVGLRPKQ